MQNCYVTNEPIAKQQLSRLDALFWLSGLMSQCFGRNCCLHLHGREVNPAGDKWSLLHGREGNSLDILLPTSTSLTWGTR
jgi:hypothetical protein